MYDAARLGLLNPSPVSGVSSYQTATRNLIQGAGKASAAMYHQPAGTSTSTPDCVPAARVPMKDTSHAPTWLADMTGP